jgi:creatinine amidohydrolase
VDEESFATYVEGVLEGIVRQGYRLLVVINGHGGNTCVLRTVASRVSSRSDTAVIVIDWWRDVAQEVRRRLFKSPGHAGEDETSAMLYIVPEAVDMSKAIDYSAPFAPRIAVYSRRLTRLLYPEAVLGEASKASREKGEEWLNSVISEIVEIVRETYRALYGEDQ